MPAVGSGEWGGLVVGEAPGANEDERGEPFVGRAGRLLDHTLAKAAGVSQRHVRKKIRVTNAVKCRPPNNRTPSPKELQACFMYLEAEVLAYKPKAILSLGNVAASALLGIGGISKLREEEWYLDDTKTVRTFITFHPAFILRQGLQSDAAELFREDVQRFVAHIRGQGKRK
jgi:DNA polymerase